MSEFTRLLTRNAVREGFGVVLLPGLQRGVSLGMTPEQADEMAELLLALAEEARRDRARAWPGLLDPLPKGKP